MNRLPVYYAAFFADAVLRRMLTYALVVYGAEVLGGARWSGVLYFALVLPYLCSVHAGGIIDRLRKRAVLQLATIMTLLLMVGLWGAAQAVAPSGAITAALVLGYGLVSAFAYPAFFAALPSVARGHSARATVIMNILAMVCYVAAPIAVGLLRVVTSWPGFFAALALLAAASTAVVWAARVPLEPVEPAPRRAGISELVDYCRTDSTLRALLIATALYSGLVVGPVDVLLPLFADRSLQLAPGAAGMFLACGGIGMVAGAVTALKVIRRGRMGWWLCGSGLAGGVLLAAMTMLPAAAAAGLFFLSGGLAGLFCSLTIAGTQVCAPDRLRGRIVGLYTVMLGAPPAIGGVLAGVLGDAVGVTTALQIVGGLTCLALAVLFLSASSLRQRDPLRQGPGLTQSAGL